MKKLYNFFDLINKINCFIDYFVKVYLMCILYIYIDDNSL